MGWHKAKALVDSGSDASTIHPLFAKESGLECLDEAPPTAKTANGGEAVIYGAGTT